MDEVIEIINIIPSMDNDELKSLAQEFLDEIEKEKQTAAPKSKESLDMAEYHMCKAIELLNENWIQRSLICELNVKS